MTDSIDDLIRRSIEQRVADSAEPRPFAALAESSTLEPRQGRFGMTTRQNQRGLMLLATAAVVLIALGGFALLSGSSDDVELIGPAVTTADESLSETTPVPTTTAPVETTPVETTSPPFTNSPTTLSPDAVRITVTQTCGDGTSGPLELETGNPEQIDDLVNTFELCEGAGGLASITYTVDCGGVVREATLDVVEGTLPDVANIDACEGAGGEALLQLEEVTWEALEEAQVEAIGCWFSPNGADEPIFFSGFDGGFIQVDGVIVPLDGVDDALDAAGFFQPGTLFSNEGYEVVLSNLGEPVETSIESTQWDVTMTVTSASGTYGPVDGVIWCGV